MMYSDKVMDHFANPRNVGVIADADGVGQVGNPVCGDMMTFYIKVKDEHLEDVKFQTFGCGAAIAVSSMVSEMAKGKTLDEGLAISNDLEAIKNYRDKKAGRASQPVTPAVAHEHEEGCSCPYCDAALDAEDKTFCRACRVEFEECPACGGITKKGDAVCIHCGKPLAGKA
jgi:nitrogen fixation NifU-like protein